MQAPARMQGKNLGSPDKVRSFEKGRMDVVNLGDFVVGRAVFEPGWKWSEHVKPVAGTDSCQVPRVGYVVSGRLCVRMDDGSEHEIGPGDAVTIPRARRLERRGRTLQDAGLLGPRAVR
jgi:quercetin dioxygenase-like cupin family protein